jgi:hypothetical protein
MRLFLFSTRSMKLNEQEFSVDVPFTFCTLSYSFIKFKILSQSSTKLGEQCEFFSEQNFLSTVQDFYLSQF